MAKLLFQTAFTAAGFSAATEVSLAEGQLRADVLVSPKLAIEVQCAPLSWHEFNHRHALYRQIHILDLWIVGQRHYLQQKIKKRQIMFFRRNKRWGSYYLEVEPARNLFRLHYRVRQEPLTRHLVYQTATFALDERGIKQFWHFRPEYKKYKLSPQKQCLYLQRQIKQKSKWGLSIAEQLYCHHLNVDQLPPSLFNTWRQPGEEDNLTKYLRKIKSH